MQKIRYRLRVLWLALSNLVRKTHTANACGHRTKKAGEAECLGEKVTFSMPLSKNGNPEYCLDCIAKMAIKCAWCGDPIHIGDPVTLYAAKKSFKVPEHAVRYDKDKECLVGCLGWNCAFSGADRQGFWVPPGKVARVPSPLEMLMAAGSDSAAVIVDDLSDPRDVGKII